MKKIIKILHLEDAPSDAELIARELKKAKINFEILVVKNKINFIKELKNFWLKALLIKAQLFTFGYL